MSRARSFHPLRILLIAGVVATAGIGVLPATNAQASTESFAISVTGGANNSQALGSATGTLTATAGGTTLDYAFQLCGQSTYPNSRLTITAGSASTTQYANSGSCQTFSGTLTSSYGFSTASLALYGSTFYPGNTYTTYSKTRSVAFSGGTTPGGGGTNPTVTSSFTASVTGGSNNSIALGTATGTITAAAGGTTATYSVTLCGQSTYPSSSVTITAGSASATNTVYYQNCQTFGGTLTSSYGFSNAQVTVSGSTFYPGNTYTTYTKSKTVYF